MRITFSILFLTLALAAETKPPVAPKDYGQFETLLAPALSPDGKWLAYGINRSSRDNELRITEIAGNSTKVAAFGTQIAFSSDSKWAAYSLGLSESQEDKLKKVNKPVHKKLGLLIIATGEQTVVNGVESFAFSPNGAYLAFRRYAPEKPEKKDKTDAADDADEAPSGATLIVRQLSSGRDTTFGNVSEYVWQDLPKQGRLLAIAISAEDKTGNGVQLFTPETGALRVLDSSASVYQGLSWRKKSADLAVLRAKTDEAPEGATQVAMVWVHLQEPSEAAHVYDPTTDSKFPTGLRVVSYRKPSWEEDGGIVFLGLAKWDKKLPSKKDKDKDKKDDEEEQAAVDVWHWRDTEVQPKQKLSAKNDRQKNMLAAWNIEQGQLLQLAHCLTEQVRPLKHQHLAYAADWTAYAMDRSIGRPAADLYLVDESTGARTKIQDKVLDDYHVEGSPGGKYLIFYQGGHYWTVDVASHAVVNITAKVKTSFADLESDQTGKQKPPFGVAGWTRNDASVVLYDKFDVWELAPDGSRATRLTDGAADQVRHRLVTLDPEEEWIDTGKPVYFGLFGIYSKKSGYARLISGREERLLFADKSVQRLAKAKDADVLAYVSETFEESPNAFVAGLDLKQPKQITHTNPFQSNYAWGHNELVEYQDDRGERLQATLYYPAGYEAGKKYPMIVYMYERLSDGLHRYSAPSERDYYNPGAITSHGYLLLMPDILFRPREPGLSVQECVGTAVKKVIALGVVDPKKIGIMGHSWGGFDTTFLATHSNLFAAGVAGAPITDLVSNYGNHHWSSGIAETDHIETGQQRMEVPLYDDLPAYIRNSAVFNVKNMTTALMIEVGDSDGTVFFHQGVELYNIARRARKNVVLLVYAGEDHGLRKKQDQMDYQRRIFAWFGHYLKDEPAPSWMTDGESYLDRERELKEIKNAGTR